MRAVLLASLALAACRPAPPRRVHSQPLPTRVEIDRGYWVDRDAGVYELRLACYEPVAETWCTGDCETHVRRADVVCPADPVTVTTASGASATATLTPGGVARLDFGARVDEDLVRVAAGTRQLKIPVDTAPRFAPPSSVEASAPPPATRRDSYVLTMLLADAALIASTVVLGNVMDDSAGNEGLGLLWTVGYLSMGAIVHAVHHNRSQAGLSVLRRLFFPVGGAFVGALAFSGQDDCSEDEFLCIDGALLGALVGFAGGMVTAMVWDAARAHVTVTAAPVQAGGMVGISARF